MINLKQVALSSLLVCSITNVYAEANDPIQNIIDNHRQQYQGKEHFTAIQVSIKSGDTIKNFVSGKVALGKNQPDLTPEHLFEIGSITKSYTAVLALQAEAREQLSLQKSLQKYLDQYPQWGHLNLIQLLNMTSGLPNYSDSPTMNMAFVTSPEHVWSPTEMAALVYKKGFNPPLRTGYDYTNMGYILMDMILHQQTKLPYAELLARDIFKPLKLRNTFYPVPAMKDAVKKRLVSGYAFNVYTNPELVGRDMKNNNLSWGGAAGGIVANSEDVLHWVQALFEEEALLNQAQKKQMQKLVSTKSGKPVERTDSEDPEGFGLGIVQKYDPNIGRFWFYEGETLGYRSLYMYLPCNKVIIVALFNSATNSENDHGGLLMTALYHEVPKQHPDLKACKS
mgnify:CR=1 FL=1